MKKTIIFFFLSAVFVLCAADIAPVLEYDFTGELIAAKGRYGKPVFRHTPVISVPDTALELKNKNYFTVPGSQMFTLKNGGTLHAVVFFKESNIKSGDNAFDMIFFKHNDFLFGRMRNELYFNMGNGKLPSGKWLTHSSVKNIPLKQWTALTAVVTFTSPDRYKTVLFINGQKVLTKYHRAKLNPPNAKTITVGMGWGGPWFMNGSIARVMLFDKPISDKQAASLAANEKYLRKK